MIEFKNYTFKYRAQKEPTIRNINLHIKKGEKVLIVGPSGSGKSTLANCINGLVPFSYHGDVTGELLIAGKSPKKLGIFGMSQYVGTVLQDPDGQFIGLTVGEDIAFALENDCIKCEEMHTKVRDAAKLVGVETLLTASPHNISGGQKQRVSMAGVMVEDVEILLFDEPLANLDPASGKHTIELIDQIHKDLGTTVIIIEHRLEDVLVRHVDRIVLVGDGEIVADLTPNELLCTDLLKEYGIREPLYITAMKYAGCQLEAKDLPDSIETIDIKRHEKEVKAWSETIQVEDTCVNGETVLKLEDVSFSYDEERQIIKDINLEIKKGEMVSVVGRNGAGKSTLSKLICGFKRPTSGTITCKGQDISGLSIKEIADHIGIVMQNPNQMISKTMIFEEVALGLKARGCSEEEILMRVEKTLKICGLYPYRNWPISALSFGQKKRVTIASILVLEPEILILDEPTAGQDFKHYTEIMEFLKGLNEQLGITILMITHDMHLMLEYTKRSIVLSDGEILADDTPARILTNDEIIEKASLKRTSLYDLALRLELESPDQFVDGFIAYDRKVRE